jgi:hypothetical protein
MVLDDEELSAFTAKSLSPFSPISAGQLMNAHYSFKSEINRIAEKK